MSVGFGIWPSLFMLDLGPKITCLYAYVDVCVHGLGLDFHFLMFAFFYNEVGAVSFALSPPTM